MTVIIFRCRWADGLCWFLPFWTESRCFRLWFEGKITLWPNYIIESEINNKWIIGWKVTMPKVNITNTQHTHWQNHVRFLWHLSCHTVCYFALCLILVTLAFLRSSSFATWIVHVICFVNKHTHTSTHHVYTWMDGVLIFRSWEYLSRLKPNCVMILAYKHDGLIALSSILTTNNNYAIAINVFFKVHLTRFMNEFKRAFVWMRILV